MRKTLISLSKNIVIKILVLVFIAVFALWGIGDMFSTGKNNIIAEISGKNIYAQEFTEQLRKEMQIQNLNNSKQVLDKNLHAKVLNNIISNKIIELYAEDEGIIINDEALANFLKQIPEFQENSKFSRTKYEKYLLQNNLISTQFENDFKKNLLRQLIIDSQIQGVLPTQYHAKLVENYFAKQASIKYLNLKNIYEDNKFQNDEIKKYYDKKPLYSNEFRSIQYAVINLKENENEDFFFKKISAIENLVLSNKTFNEISEKFSLTKKISEFFNVNGIDDNSKKVSFDKKIINKSFLLNDQIHTDLVEVSGNFYLFTINKIIPKKIKPLDELTKKKIIEIMSKEKIKDKIDKLKLNKDNKNFEEIFNQNKKLTKTLFISSRFNKNLIFSTSEIQQILEFNDNDFFILESNDNYLINIEKISFNNKEVSQEMKNLFQKQVIKDFQDQILISFDKFLNQKYNIKINQKVLDRIINSF